MHPSTFLLLSTLGIAGVAGVMFHSADAPDAPTPSQESTVNPKTTPLPEDARRVLEEGATEPPFSGKWLHNPHRGIYVCRRCGNPLFASDAKFDSGTGWPSFDAALPDGVALRPDPDGLRTETTCAACGGHLGHTFTGERFTPKNTRHCANSVAMDFVPEAQAIQTAYFAGGCFWGVEYWLEKEPGVVRTTVGYMGGHTTHPTYEQVCTGTTGHAETVKVEYDPRVVSFRHLATLFFEIHDPTQRNRQGPDVGTQYRSAVFYTTDAQQLVTASLLEALRDRGLSPVTQVEPAEAFWPAETYHHHYYRKNGKAPYCHRRTPRFGP